jgi:gas vesicle protein
MEIKAQHKNVLIAGALIGAILGAGAAWLLVNNPIDDGEGIRKPIAPGELVKLTSRLALLARDVNDLRRRM